MKILLIAEKNSANMALVQLLVDGGVSGSILFKSVIVAGVIDGFVIGRRVLR